MSTHTAPEGPRLLVVTTIPGTLRAFLLPYADHFRARGWRVDAMTSADASVRPHVMGSFDHVWEVPWHRGMFSFGNVRAAAQVRHIVRREGYDLVHVHTPVAAATTRLSLRRGPHTSTGPRVVYTAHGFHLRGDAPWTTRHVAAAVERMAGRFTDHLIVLNEEDESLARRMRLVAPDRVERLPGIGIDLAHFRRTEVTSEALAQVRAQAGVPPGHRMVLMIAEFSPRKRHRDAVRALALLARRDVHLVCVGAGELMDATRALARDLDVHDQVHAVGRRDDVRPWLACADLLVLPSGREGMPRSVMEAMAMGTPVVGSDTAGTRDLLRDGRGHLVPVGDVAGLADAIQRVLTDPRDTAARVEAASAHVAGDLGIDRLVAAHERIYDRLLARSEVTAT